MPPLAPRSRVPQLDADLLSCFGICYEETDVSCKRCPLASSCDAQLRLQLSRPSIAYMSVRLSEACAGRTAVEKEVNEQDDPVAVAATTYKEAFGKKQYKSAGLVRSIMRLYKWCESSGFPFRLYCEAQCYWARERKARQVEWSSCIGKYGVGNYNAYIRRTHRRYRSAATGVMSVSPRVWELRSTLRRFETAAGSFLVRNHLQGKPLSWQTTLIKHRDEIPSDWVVLQKGLSPTGVVWNRFEIADECRAARLDAMVSVIESVEHGLSEWITVKEEIDWEALGEFLSIDYLQPPSAHRAAVPDNMTQWHREEVNG